MQEECQERLASRGYVQYEVSAYAQADRQCAHNLNYWRFGDYMGIGAGAHGKLTIGSSIVRTARVRQPREYLAAHARGANGGSRARGGERTALRIHAECAATHRWV